jgi:hypothetical protein
MQVKTIALAAAFAVTSSLALAQAGGNNAGATVPERSGTAVDGNGGAVRTAHDGRMMDRERGATTGMSRDNQSGPGLEPAERDRSRPGGEGVNSMGPH